jgi:PAS domain S-box-containing protein
MRGARASRAAGVRARLGFAPLPEWVEVWGRAPRCARHSTQCLEARINAQEAIEPSGWGFDPSGFLPSILDCVAEPVWVVDHQGVIEFANPAAAATLGYRHLDELRGRPSHETIHYQHGDGTPFPVDECPLLRPRLTGETVRVEEDWFVRKDGSMFPVRYVSAPIETPAGRGAVVAFTDIAERRRAEDALREHDVNEARNAELRASESRMRALLEAAFDAIVSTDRDGRVTYFNAAAQRTFGYSTEETIGREVVMLIVPPRLRERHRRWWSQRLLAGERDMLGRQIEAVAMHADGREIPVEFTVAELSLAGSPGFTAYFRDITERRHAAEQAARERDLADARAMQLAASERQQRSILEAALDCVISSDETGRVTYFNAAAERIFGCPADQVIGQEMADVIVPPSLRDAHRRGFARHLATGERRILDRHIELTAMRADGAEFPAELAITRVDLPGGPVFTGYLRDISERKRAEEDLRDARRRVIEAADGERRRIARDLHDGAQQQLVNVEFNLQLAAQQMGVDTQSARESIALARDEARAGTVALREMVAGIHPAILTHRGLAAAIASLAGRLPVPVELSELHDGRLAQSVEAGAYFVISEALTNVVKHARASQARVQTAVAEGHLVAVVSDNGVGGATRSGGSGLTGLADRVAALDGTLDLVSDAGRGTTLRCRIPLEGRSRPSERGVH